MHGLSNDGKSCDGTQLSSTLSGKSYEMPTVGNINDSSTKYYRYLRTVTIGYFIVETIDGVN